MADEVGIDANDISPDFSPQLATSIIGFGGGAVGSSMALGPLALLAGEDLGDPEAHSEPVEEELPSIRDRIPAWNPPGEAFRAPKEEPDRT